MSKWLIYMRIAIMGIELFKELFSKTATPETREKAIGESLVETRKIFPKTSSFIKLISEDDVSALAELADILNEWEPEE
ncbi:hypothetical protein LCGC14_1083860 [marine sediment metagenome]|uniref:Uncharacterized protein n=1 Tax=marine sediment metagenome TaxID=412755 RepID=A0A0F9MEM0_9ZZZZ